MQIILKGPKFPTPDTYILVSLSNTYFSQTMSKRETSGLRSGSRLPKNEKKLVLSFWYARKAEKIATQASLSPKSIWVGKIWQLVWRCS
jgi:hypothetical protein